MDVTPEYRLISEEGPDHDKIFIVGVYVNDKKIESGKGRSKQIAENKAAQKALKTYIAE